MQAFTFNTTPSIVFEAGSAKRFGAIAGKRLGPTVLFVTDPGLRKLGLCDAAGDRNRRRAAVGALQPPDVRIDLLGRLFADVAGVEHDEIRVGALGGGYIALGAQHLGHSLAVIDIHLAAEGFDVKCLGRVGFHRRAIGDATPRRKSGRLPPFPP